MSETTFERYKEKLERTSITEKLDYKTLLIHALRTVETSILSGETVIIEDSIWTLYNLIPTTWHDEAFKKAIKKCYFTEKVDVRPVFCGVPPSIEYCEEHGIPTFKEEIIFDYKKLYRACINLLDRRGLTARRKFTEKFTGKPHKKESENIADSEAYEF